MKTASPPVDRPRLLLIVEPTLSRCGWECLKWVLERGSMRWGVHWTAERCAQPCRRLPRRKEERLALATSYYERLLRRSRAGQVNGVIVGLGQMPCELLTGASRISLKANCSWEHPEFGHVWVTFSPDYAIATDMALLPDISATFTLAGREYGIETRFDERLREPPPKFKRLCYGFCQVGGLQKRSFLIRGCLCRTC